MRLDVVVSDVLPHAIETVWGALTERAAISRWLMETSGFEPAVGTRFRMRTQHLAADGWVRAEVLELEPPTRMVWAWAADDVTPPTTVVFELVPEDGGTRLTISHRGEMEPGAGAILRGGWPGRIDELRRILGRERP
jgi:uncharacterized protein YndB with AHSA1/START domain